MDEVKKSLRYGLVLVSAYALIAMLLATVAEPVGYMPSSGDELQLQQPTLLPTPLTGIMLEEEGDPEIKLKRHWLTASFGAISASLSIEKELAEPCPGVPADKTLQLFSLYHQFF